MALVIADKGLNTDLLKKPGSQHRRCDQQDGDLHLSLDTVALRYVRPFGLESDVVDRLRHVSMIGSLAENDYVMALRSPASARAALIQAEKSA
jgi:hypothetical protein